MLLGSVGIPAVGATATAAPSVLYVNKASGANCTDSGPGSQSAPFCSIAAAAAVVQAGQTVDIGDGTYLEDLVITRSGTESAPITFRGRPVAKPTDGGAWIGGSYTPGKGIVVKGAEHVRFENLTVRSGHPYPALVADNARHITFTNIAAHGNTAVHVTNGSQQVTLARSTVESGGPPVLVDGGSTGTVLTTNEITPYSVYDGTGVVVQDAPDTLVVSNSVITLCFAGIVVNGASTGAVVKNNVVDTARQNHESCATTDVLRTTGITVAESAVAGTTVDYNVVDSRSGGPAYRWAGVSYTTQAEFTAASGQGAHDFVAQTYGPKGPDTPLSPVYDSADETAPGMLPVDRAGNPAVDNPHVRNTATGGGFRDRGARELNDFGSFFNATVPTRLLDTRAPIGVPSAQAVAPFGTVDLQVTGVNGVPANGVTAVTMNVTVTDPQQTGHLIVYPHGQERPTTSNLNWAAGRTIPNLVTVPVKDGKVSFYNASGGTVHVLADLAGYYTTEGRLTYKPTGPRRVMDTRVFTSSEHGSRTAGTVPARGTLDMEVDKAGPAATLNVTVTEPGAAGHLVVHPYGDPRPNASNLNFERGETIANQVMVTVKDRNISLYNASDAPIHIVVDLFGYQTY